MDDPELREALRPSWTIPGAVELLVAGVVIGLGLYYDYIERLPGPLVGLGIALLTGRWVLVGRLQWAAVQRYLAMQRGPPGDLNRLTERASKRHGRAAVVRAIQALDEGRTAKALPAPAPEEP